MGLTELVHGVYRASTPEVRLRRESFLNELLADLTVYPFTKETALLAGRLDAEQRSRGVIIPFADLLIGATARLMAARALSLLATSSIATHRFFPWRPNLSEYSWNDICQLKVGF